MSPAAASLRHASVRGSTRSAASKLACAPRALSVAALTLGALPIVGLGCSYAVDDFVQLDDDAAPAVEPTGTPSAQDAALTIEDVPTHDAAPSGSHHEAGRTDLRGDDDDDGKGAHR